MVGLFVMPYAVISSGSFIVIALRTKARKHLAHHAVTRVAVAASTALTVAYTIIVVQDGVLYGCDTLWWTLECWLWA